MIISPLNKFFVFFDLKNLQTFLSRFFYLVFFVSPPFFNKPKKNFVVSLFFKFNYEFYQASDVPKL